MSLIRRIKFYFLQKKLRKDEMYRNLDERIMFLEKELAELKGKDKPKPLQQDQTKANSQVLYEWLYGAE